MIGQFFSVKMLLSWLVTLAGIAILLYIIFRKAYGDNQPGQDPLRVARERYARGEITGDEYLRIKENLK